MGLTEVGGGRVAPGAGGAVLPRLGLLFGAISPIPAVVDRARVPPGGIVPRPALGDPHPLPLVVAEPPARTGRVEVLGRGVVDVDRSDRALVRRERPGGQGGEVSGTPGRGTPERRRRGRPSVPPDAGRGRVVEAAAGSLLAVVTVVLGARRPLPQLLLHDVLGRPYQSLHAVARGHGTEVARPDVAPGPAPGGLLPRRTGGVLPRGRSPDGHKGGTPHAAPVRRAAVGRRSHPGVVRRMRGADRRRLVVGGERPGPAGGEARPRRRGRGGVPPAIILAPGRPAPGPGPRARTAPGQDAVGAHGHRPPPPVGGVDVAVARVGRLDPLVGRGRVTESFPRRRRAGVAVPPSGRRGVTRLVVGRGRRPGAGRGGAPERRLGAAAVRRGEVRRRVEAGGGRWWRTVRRRGTAVANAAHGVQGVDLVM